MKILHTSDWHLGRSLYGRKRYDEFSAFLDWLCDVIQQEEVDVLLMAGDVFDTSTPSVRAQTLYYQFLCRVAISDCRHVVITGGNHDSPAFLNAPKALLRALNVYVVASVSENLNEEVVTLRDVEERPEAIVCAVPYLREKDIRTVELGESAADKHLKLVEGVQEHYAAVCEIAEEKRSNFEADGLGRVPLLAMGHLFAAGGQTVDGDGVRELYVGSLARVSAETFPASINYIALGHLHVPQSVGGEDHIRYCGSPIPMGYGEAAQKKQVILVEFEGTTPKMTEVQVPCFQPLVRLVGDLDYILVGIEQLKQDGSKAWLEIEYTGAVILPDLKDSLYRALENSDLEIRRIKNRRMADQAMEQIEDNEALDDLDVHDVFGRCLDAFEVADEDRESLKDTYQELLDTLDEAD